MDINPGSNLACPDCGMLLPVGSRFCQHCGAKVILPSMPNPTSGIHIGDIGLLQGAIDQSNHTTTNIGTQNNYSGPVNININQGSNTRSDPNYFDQGITCLRNRMYTQAAANFNQAASIGEGGIELFYYLVLSQLGGKRPRNLPFGVIQNIQRMLKTAVESRPDLSKAWVLWALVIEDYYILNKMPEPEPGVNYLLQKSGRLDREDVQEIAVHLNAPGNRIWEQLR